MDGFVGIKLPKGRQTAWEEAARARGIGVSELVRRAVESDLGSDERRWPVVRTELEASLLEAAKRDPKQIARLARLAEAAAENPNVARLVADLVELLPARRVQQRVAKARQRKARSS
jgi:hypothetical protein